ncbi:hypothetical protein DTW92_01575 [Paracoccus pantotrophus]|nr:hypothetical protein DTW92_01575 [Paracoccus pantotrophus]WGR67072.1 hypothetical protein E3U24_17645 [Paracoccus pantotrophus]
MIPIPGHDASPYAVKGRIEPILASACGHHRLLWVHPFLDGNGRVAPLMSYAMLRQALEGRVAAREPFINGLDVDRGDVIGQQQDLIGVQFIAEFVLQLVGLDQARLQQARDEGAGAGEGGDDMDALGAEGLAELILQHVIDGADDPASSTPIEERQGNSSVAPSSIWREDQSHPLVPVGAATPANACIAQDAPKAGTVDLLHLLPADAPAGHIRFVLRTG